MKQTNAINPVHKFQSEKTHRPYCQGIALPAVQIKEFTYMDIVYERRLCIYQWMGTIVGHIAAVELHFRNFTILNCKSVKFGWVGP
jgi:hypothetical protein